MLQQLRLRSTLLLLFPLLVGTLNAQNYFTIGTGTGSNGNQAFPTPFGNYYWGQRSQYLYLASELTGAGMSAGNITHIRFNVTALNSCPALQGYTVKMKHLASTASLPTGTNMNNPEAAVTLTTVFGPSTVTPVLGTNTITLATPFAWNGTQNLLVEICSNNAAFVLGGNASVQWTTGLAFNGSRNHAADNATNCSTTGASVNLLGTQTTRPNIQFGMPAPPCSGTPTAGTVPATATACPGGTTVINATGATTGTGITYQWEEFVSGSWGAVVGGSGATTTSYTTPAINSARQFRLRVTCTNSGLSANSSAVTVSPGLTPTCYCSGALPSTVTDDGTGVRNVTFNTINNTSAGGPAYTDFTAVQTTVNAGGSYPLSVSVNTAGDFLVTATAWIDWNQNAVFEVGEEYGMGTAQNGNPLLTSLSPRTINVPINALGGSTIMRVRATYFDAPTACGSQDYTEAEDYRINVVACTPPTANMSVVNDCGNNQFSVAVNVTGLGSGSQANIVYTVNGGAPTTLSNVGLGTTTIGPFASTAVVTAFVNNGPVACATGTSTFYSGCPIPIVCGNTVEIDHCYGNFDTRTFHFTASNEFETITLTFTAGTMDPVDVIRIYDSPDNSGTMILSGSFASLVGVGITNSGPDLFMEIDSDGSNSCATGQQSTWSFEAECTAGCIDPTGTVTVNTNCAAYNFTAQVTVTSTGDAGTVDIQYTVNGGAPQIIADVPPDAVEVLGPFAIDDQVNIRLLHETDGACNKNLGTFTDDNSCPTADNCVNALNLGTQTSPLSSTTVGRAADFSFACGTASTNTAPDAIYYIDVPNGQQLTIRQVTNDYDSQHYVRYGGSCPGTTEIACVDDDNGEVGAVTWTNSTGSTQRVWWIQDGYSANAGNFTLEWNVAPPPVFNLATCAQNLPILDGGCVDALFNISGQPSSLGTNVGLESIDLILTHTWREDMDITLETPGGQIINLILDRGGDNNNFGNNGNCPTAVFKLKDGGAALSGMPVANNTTGTWAPEQPLASLTGNPNGLWKLHLCDDTGGDSGALRYLKLNFLPIDCQGVLGGAAMPGTACNDGNACTINDTWSVACNCAGTFQDTDGDGTCNANDGCPNDPNKIAAGQCGCGVADTDDDNDGTANCNDGCPNDPNKIAAGQCGCGVPDTDSDNDGTANCNDACPNDPNKIAPGQCGCGVVDTDSDNDGIADCNDSCPNDANNDVDGDGICGDVDNCPNVFGQIGNVCDANPGPDYTLGQLDGSCQCQPVACSTTLNLIFNPDGVTDIQWQLREQGTNTIVQSGGGVYPPAPEYGITTCLPNGSYYLVVTSNTGGIVQNGVQGGYRLRTAGGSMLVDNRNNFLSGTTSQIAGGEGFNLPIGFDRTIYVSSDKLDWQNNEYIYATDNPAVTATYGVDNVNNGYQMWWYNPNGGYSFRRFQNHNTSNGLPASATRACGFKINSWSGNQLQDGTLYNVKVRSMVNGVYGNWGAATRFRIDAARAQCPLTNLMDLPGNQFVSCGGTRALGTSQPHLVHARPVKKLVNGAWVNANRYQFRFISENTIIKTSNTNQYWVYTGSAPSLAAGVTYEVEVRASFDNGATWCDAAPGLNPFAPKWGKVCLLTISGAAQGGNQNMAAAANNAEVSLYPNPNNGQQLTLSLSEVEAGTKTVTVDILDTFGKRVSARTIAVNDTFVNTVLDLNGELAAGMYLVNITAGANTYTERLVIQP